MTVPMHIVLAHGGGGQLSMELIEEVILPILGGQDPQGLTDAARLELPGGRYAFTTDSYVVQPLEFPGGDIGKLAVCGTINDLAVSGARPVALSMALVLEEGLEIELLRRVLASAAGAARAAGVGIVTGDTKVVERRPGAAQPGLTINTAGIGAVLDGAHLAFDRVEEGDAIVLSGPLGEHGMAVMGQRKGLAIASDLVSDCASIAPLTEALIAELGPAVRWMRDPTRGGLAATLSELSAATRRNLEIDQRSIPVDPTAAGAAEILGLDLLSVANEGKLVAVVAADAGECAAGVLADYEIAARAAVIGRVGARADLPLVEMVTRAGGRRVVQMPYGEDLPRIC